MEVEKVFPRVEAGSVKSFDRLAFIKFHTFELLLSDSHPIHQHPPQFLSPSRQHVAMTSTLFPDTLSRLLRRPSAPNLRSSSSSSSSPTLRPANRDSFEDEEIDGSSTSRHAFPSPVEGGMRASVSLDRMPVEGLGIDIAWADEPESSRAAASSYFPATTSTHSHQQHTSSASHSSLASVLQHQHQRQHSSPFSFPSSAQSSRPCSPRPSAGAAAARPTPQKVQPNLRRVRAASSVLAQLSHALQEDAESARAKQRVRTTSHPAAAAVVEAPHLKPARYRTHSEHDTTHLAAPTPTPTQQPLLTPTRADAKRRSTGSRFLSLPSRQGSLPWLLGTPKQTSPTAEAPAELSGVFSPPPAYSSGEEDGASVGAADEGELDEEALEDEEDDDEADSFTLDLYLSSLTHLLSALPASHAKALPAKQKAALVAALRDALSALEPEPAPQQQQQNMEALVPLNSLGAAAGAAEWVTLQNQAPERVHHLHAHTHHVFHHGVPSFGGQMLGPATGQAHLAELSSSGAFGMIGEGETTTRKERSRRRKAAAMLALPALELGLSLTAAALSVSARAAARLVAPLEAQPLVSPALSTPGSPTSGSAQQVHCTNCGHTQHVGDLTTLEAAVQRAAQTPRETSQWDAPLALAKAAGSALYVQLGAAAQRASASPSSSPRAQTTALAPSSAAAEAEVEPEAEVPYTLVQLARAVKRSPLPSALAQVSSTLTHTASLIDARYDVRSRCADAALRNTSRALRYVRRNELHTRAVAAAWEAAEAGVAAVQAYREQEAWAAVGARAAPAPGRGVAAGTEEGMRRVELR